MWAMGGEKIKRLVGWTCRLDQCNPTYSSVGPVSWFGPRWQLNTRQPHFHSRRRKYNKRFEDREGSIARCGHGQTMDSGNKISFRQSNYSQITNPRSRTERETAGLQSDLSSTGNLGGLRGLSLPPATGQRKRLPRAVTLTCSSLTWMSSWLSPSSHTKESSQNKGRCPTGFAS